MQSKVSQLSVGVLLIGMSVLSVCLWMVLYNQSFELYRSFSRAPSKQSVKMFCTFPPLLVL